jgi:hypothetical protein
MKILPTMLAAALLTIAANDPALGADDLAKRVAECAREKDDAQRLACFDRVAAAAAPHDAFGVHGSELARSQVDDPARQDDTPKRITATVTGIEKRVHGELVFTLDNGQVWAQKEVGPYFPIKTGDAVTILAGSLGSHKLIIANRSTSVTRVR